MYQDGVTGASGRAARSAFLAAALLLLAGPGGLLGVPITFDAVPPQAGQEAYKYFWNITLHNPTASTSSVFFRVEARDAKAGSVFSGSSQPIALAPGDRRLTAADVKFAEVWCRNGYEAFARPGPVLPEGDYTYVIALMPGMRQAAFFLRVRSSKPAELIWPPNGATVGDSQPTFVWTQPVASGPIVTYNYVLHVVETGKGQTGSAAITRNEPVLEVGRLATTAFRAPAPAAFIAGRTYAWRVTVTDTTGTPMDVVHTRSQSGTFRYRPGSNPADAHTSFTFPHAGRSVTGYASLAVTSDVPNAEVCVFEYSLGSDSAGRDWHVIGPFPQVKGSFVGMWTSDSAVINAQKTFPSTCVVRATVLGRGGQSSQTEPLPLVINQPPVDDRKGCGGCNWIPEE